jgi:hypothetical protein
LKQIRTAEELQRFLQDYAHVRCGSPKNAPLDMSILALSRSWPAKEREDVDAVIKAIDAAVYAGKAVEMENLTKRSLLILAALNRRAKNTRDDKERLQILNPS